MWKKNHTITAFWSHFCLYAVVRVTLWSKLEEHISSYFSVKQFKNAKVYCNFQCLTRINGNFRNLLLLIVHVLRRYMSFDKLVFLTCSLWVTANFTNTLVILKNRISSRFTKEKTTMDIISSSVQWRASTNHSLICVYSSDIMSESPKRKFNFSNFELKGNGFIKSC